MFSGSVVPEFDFNNQDSADNSHIVPGQLKKPFAKMPEPETQRMSIPSAFMQTGHFLGKLSQLFMNNEEKNDDKAAFENLESLGTGRDKLQN